ncbi:Kri1p [Ascoidea rubescens DSM 1968]|uniref:Krr1-domain-containing protein n=1 Tax=Ascoidea rubescens DSM 1968 TaxID=1344418 RepID=A0A1D2VL59_9ASCO|nr:Krr1-domain-containing protein [Ascoidea rubescens DSM 1968]ODV62350.1 Krr1-domain-containing protein [Ascoidea rubescens DSM 1968]
MARKKSNARKLREAQEKAKLQFQPKETKEITLSDGNSVEERADLKSKLNSNSYSDSEFDSRSESESDSDSEDEDEFGELLTENIETGINKVLNAIKTNDKSIFDPDAKFFQETKEDEISTKNPKDKPIYLKDYQTMNLLKGNANDDEFKSIDGKKTFAESQAEDKKKLVDEIKNFFSEDSSNEDKDKDEDDDDDNDGFLVKKKKSERAKIPEIITNNLPDPEKDQEKFLQEYFDKHAWIPKKSDKKVNLNDGVEDEEDDDEFDEAAENFEKAYNFRFEDPNAADIVSYSRNQLTVRRNKLNSRKKQRLKKHEIAKVEKAKKDEQLQKKKQKKINLVVDRINEIQKELDGDIDSEKIIKVFGDALLDEDFDNEEWDKKMNEIYNDEFYKDENVEDIKEDINKDLDEDVIMSENDNYDDKENEEDDKESEEDDNKNKGEVKKGSKKHKLKEKKSKKKQKEKIKVGAEKLVNKNKLKLIDEIDEEEEKLNKDRNKDGSLKFKYKEVEPETFGLSIRDIWGADDVDLNEYISLKKFAPYRKKELIDKDKKKVTKPRRLREWRKKTFKSEKGPYYKKTK